MHVILTITRAQKNQSIQYQWHGQKKHISRKTMYIPNGKFRATCWFIYYQILTVRMINLIEMVAGLCINKFFIYKERQKEKETLL